MIKEVIRKELAALNLQARTFNHEIAQGLDDVFKLFAHFELKDDLEYLMAFKGCLEKASVKLNGYASYLVLSDKHKDEIPDMFINRLMYLHTTIQAVLSTYDYMVVTVKYCSRIKELQDKSCNRCNNA